MADPTERWKAIFDWSAQTSQMLMAPGNHAVPVACIPLCGKIDILPFVMDRQDRKSVV